MTIERRSFDCELRVIGGKRLEGYAARFNSLSQNLGGFVEKIAPGAFKRSIEGGADVRCLLNHDPNYVLGRTTSGTLELREDGSGLKIVCHPPSATWCKDLMLTIARGDISQMSFGFRVAPNGDTWDRQGEANIRTLLDVDLVDVSPVTFPAYTDTEIQARNRGKNMRDDEIRVRAEMKRLVVEAEDIARRAKSENRSLSADENNQFMDLMLRFDAQVDELGGMGVRELRYWRDSGLDGVHAWLFSGIRPNPGSYATSRQNAETGGMAEFRAFLRGERRGGNLQLDKDTAGGFTVPIEFYRQVIEEKKRRTPIRGISRVITLNAGDSLEVPKLADRVRDPSWTSELNLGVADDATSFEKVGFHCRPLAVYVKCSMDLLEVSGVDIGVFLKDQLAYKFAVVEENAFLNGSGGGQPLGVFQVSDSGITSSRDVSTGNSATEQKADNLIEVFHKLEPQYQPTSTWVMHQDVVKGVRKLKDGNGQYLWRAGISAGEPNTILDRPHIISMYAPNTMTSGLYTAIIGDWSAFWIVESITLKVTILDQLFAATNQVAYVGRERLDANVVDQAAFARAKLA